MADKLIFELVSPSALLASDEVEMVVVPGEDGDFGVLIGHSPVLSNLRPGVVDLYNDGQISNSLFVDGGFAEVTDERCTLLATNAKHVNEISAEEVAGRLEAAEAQIAEAEENNKNLAERELSAAQAMKYAFETRSSAQLT